MEKVAISVQELADKMGISIQTAYGLVKEPGFPAIHVGRRILVPVEQLREWIVSHSENKSV